MNYSLNLLYIYYKYFVEKLLDAIVIEPLRGIHQNRATKLHNINVILFQNLAGGKNEKNVN